MKATLLLPLLLFTVALTARTIIDDTGQAGGRTGGVINVNGSWYNNGTFTPNTGTVRFCGAGADTVGGATANTFYKLMVDKADGTILWIDNDVTVQNSLLLRRGVLAKTATRAWMEGGSYEAMGTRVLAEALGQRSSRLLNGDNPSRLGSFTMANNSSIIREYGSIAFSPTYAGYVDITYLQPCTTGPEMANSSGHLYRLNLSTSGTVTLDRAIRITNYLHIYDGLFDLNGYICRMSTSAFVDADPEDIIGTLRGTASNVGTGSYNNSTLGVSLTSGNDIGYFEPLVYVRSVGIGADEGIVRRWQLLSTNPPLNRDMYLRWPSSSDNGLDLSNTQAYRQDGDAWIAVGPPRDLTGSSSTRSYLVEDVDSFSHWTIDECEFSLSSYALNFGTVDTGDSSTLPFTITNTQSDVLTGEITTPDGYTIALATRAGAPLLRMPAVETRDTRNTLAYSIAAGGSATFNLTFDASISGTYNGNVIISSTRTGTPTRWLPVRGIAAYPPDITLNPESMSAELQTNQTASQTLSVGNDGEQSLEWIAEVAWMEEYDSEGFEDTFPPTGWSVEILEQTNGWTQSSISTHSGTYSALADWHNVYDSRLVTAAFTVPVDGLLQYWLRSYDNPIYGGYFAIEISTDGATWTALDSFNQNTLTTSFQLFEVDLSGYVGQTVQIGFRVYENYWTNGVFLDDITLMGQSATPGNWVTIDGADNTEGAVGAGLTYDISVDYNSAGMSDGAYSAQIVVTSNDPDEPELVVPVSLIVATPSIVVAPSSLEFGDVEVYDNSTLNFTIENSGSAELTGDITTPDGFTVDVYTRAATSERDFATSRAPAVQSRTRQNKVPVTPRNTLTYSVPAGQIVTYEVTFEPAVPDAYIGNIVITHNAAGDPQTIAVSGNGIQADIDVSPVSFNFTLATDEQESDVLNITNYGTAPLRWYVSAQYPSRRTELVYSGFEDAVPPAGWSSEILVGSQPWDISTEDAVAGTYCARADWHTLYDARLITPEFLATPDCQLSYWIRSQDNPLYGGEYSVEVSVAGGDWTTLYTCNQNTFTTTFQQLQHTLSAYAGQSIRVAFRAWNNFYKDGILLDEVSITGTPPEEGWITFDGAYAAGGEIAPGDPADAVNVTVNSDGFSDGLYTADIVIESNDPDETPLSIPITMTVATPGISVSPTTIDFGVVFMGQSGSQGFTIENTGNAELTGEIITMDYYSVSATRNARITTEAVSTSRQSATLSDRASSQQSLVPDTPSRETLTYSIPAGQTAGFNLVFAPPAWGNYDSAVTITHNAPGDTRYIDINADAADIPTVTTASVSGIEATFATGGGEVTGDCGMSVTARGVCWSTSQNPTTEDTHTTDGTGTGVFTSSITGLMPNTVYYVRAYATNAVGTAYGNQVNFTSAKPVITVSGNIDSFGEVAVENVSVPQNYLVSAVHLIGDVTVTAPTAFEICLTSDGTYGNQLVLTPVGYTLPVTTVYVRFAPVTGGIVNRYVNHTSPSAVIKYKAVSGTGVVPATVSTATITDIDTETATGGGNVTNAGYGTISARGVCWSTSQNPTLADAHTADSTGTGEFVSSLTGLSQNTTYYVRAYVVNVAGTSYGNQVNFTTLGSALNPPQNLTITAFNEAIVIAWDDVSGAISYLVYAADEPGGPWTNVTSEGAFGGGSGRTDWTTTSTATRKYYYIKASTTPARLNP